MRILFMGTPEFAVASLKSLVEAGHTLCGVFSQPDKPVGRHQNLLKPTPVKEYAISQDIPVFQPVKLRDGSALSLIESLEPELIVVAAYGRILPDDILAYPKKGCINVHSSLLPKYRGAAPIQWAILNGESETGVTIMDVVHDLDAGDILAQAVTPITADDTAETLHDRLAEMGGKLLVETVAEMEAGRAVRRAQDESLVTLAPMLSRELSPMDFTRSAAALHDQVRGLVPWPCAVTELGGKRCKLLGTQVIPGHTDAPAGAVIRADKGGLQLACGGGSILQIDLLQPDGGKRMTGADFLRGHPL